MTNVLFAGVKRFVSRKADVVSPALRPKERRAMVSTAATLLKKGTAVALEDFAGQVVSGAKLVARAPGGQLQAIRDALTEDLASRGRPDERIARGETVPIDSGTAAARAAKITYVLDGGIQITGDATEIDRRVAISEPDVEGRMTVSIETQTLEIL
jgi:hypothetical protein